MSTISLNTVVKNEILTIYKMLSSVKYLVKEMVIVDTGSTDGTLEVIKNFRDKNFKNLKLIEMPMDEWTGPLCVKARQAALDQTTHPWVLVLDSDEELSRLLDGEIRAFVNRPTHDCMRLRRVSFLEGRPNQSDAIMRLFKNNVGYRWFVRGDGFWFEEISLNDKRVVRNTSSTSKNELYHFGWYRLPPDVWELKKQRYSKTGYAPFVEKMP